jgi:hypothetical protein
VAVAVVSKAEDLMAWVRVTSAGASGLIEDVVIMPAADGALDDDVYYVVKRTISGSTVRYLEKWAQEVDCRGDQQYCHLADSSVTYSGLPTVTIPVAHLEGEQVVVWADGDDVGTNPDFTLKYTVVGGTITLPVAASTVTVGLPYVAQFKSSKLGEAQGTPLNIQKRVEHIGVILADTHPQGLRYGADFDLLDTRPQIEDGAPISGMTVAYDQNLMEFPGLWTTDARVCLQAQAPMPCNVMSVTIGGQVNG